MATKRLVRLRDAEGIFTLDNEALERLPEDRRNLVSAILRRATASPVEDSAVSRKRHEARKAQKAASLARVAEWFRATMEVAKERYAESSRVSRVVSRVQGGGRGSRLSLASWILAETARIMHSKQEHPFADEVMEAAAQLGVPLERGTQESIAARKMAIRG